MSCAKPADPVEILFGKQTYVGLEKYVIRGGPESAGEGTVFSGHGGGSKYQYR